MPHLSLETIARLVDEAPDAAERAHLDACVECRRTLEDMRADLAALQALPALEPPAEEWPAIETRLAAEGLLRHPRQRIAWQLSLLRAAAAVAIFVFGGFTGAIWTGQRLPASDERTALGPGPVTGPSITQQSPRVAAPARLEGGDVRPAPGLTRPVRSVDPALADNPLAVALLTGRLPQTHDEAVLLLGEAEALYLSALTRLTELGPNDVGDPIARVAALEGIAAITRAALDRAPADPVLNGYHITAIAQREAALRQIAATTGGSWF